MSLIVLKEGKVPQHYPLPSWPVSRHLMFNHVFIQTFCGRRVEIESVPLEITRTITTTTTADEENKTPLVAVSETEGKRDAQSSYQAFSYSHSLILRTRLKTVGSLRS